jgi:hypothetical protein
MKKVPISVYMEVAIKDQESCSPGCKHLTMSE